MFIASLVFLFVINWKLTLVMLGVTPPIVIVMLIFMRLFKKYSKLYQDKLAIANSIANEVFGNIRIVRSFAN